MLILREKSDEVQKLIAGPSVHICDECVELCNSIVEEDQSEKIENKNIVLAPFSHDGTVKFMVDYDDSKNEVHLSLNRIACLAFSNIFTQLGIIQFDKSYSVEMNNLGYENQGYNLRITTDE